MTAAAERIYGASDPKYRRASAPPPRAWVDPDREKGWLERLRPILFAHRTLILASLAAGLLVAAAGAVTPRLVRWLSCWAAESGSVCTYPLVIAQPGRLSTSLGRHVEHSRGQAQTFLKGPP